MGLSTAQPTASAASLPCYFAVAIASIVGSSLPSTGGEPITLESLLPEQRSLGFLGLLSGEIPRLLCLDRPGRTVTSSAVFAVWW